MALDPGTRFGPYEVVGKLGAGGMGEVYRATDTKLGRDVAIKTLPATLAGDAERLARFEREAKLLATLNHPHIASVYGLDEHAGTLYLAMELVEGQTLEAKLKAGALAVEDALRLALQVAEALEAAHGKGVVHRDLKPANIMVTDQAQVKVLDFGLAKAFSGAAGEASPAHSPALSLAMTQQGLVLGTAGYMSPEQASGQGTDQRADVWSFGVVLYEMLTGLPLFRGESVPHILADVLKTEPDWNRLPANLHPRIRQLLERCLTKRPRDRLHSIADARIEIEGVLAAPEGVQPAVAAAVVTARPKTWRRVAEIVFIAVVAVAAGWFLHRPALPRPGPVARFEALLPAEQALTADPVSLVAISPDGTRIVYAADKRLYLRNLDEPETRPIPGTQMTGTFGAALPTFSPDGQWLAFVDTPSATGPYTIMRVPVSGGTPVRLYAAQGPPNYEQGITWSTTDTILFANAEGIVRIPANGGDAEVLVPRKEDERFYSPQLLPGGKAVLFTRASGTPGSLSGFDDAEIVVQSIGKDDRAVIRKEATAARYLPTGHIVYAAGTTLFALPFDVASLSVHGGPVPLLDTLRRSSNGVSDTANYAVSDNGTLVYLPGGPSSGATAGRIQTTLSWVDRDGRDEPLPIRADDYTYARVSPNGTKAALVVHAQLVRDLPPTIWIYDFQTQNLSLLTTKPAVQDGPVWSADSRRLYFRAPNEIGDAQDIHVIDLESGDVSVVMKGSADGSPYAFPWSISPSGDTLAVIDAKTADDVDFSTVALPDGKLTRGLYGEGAQGEPSFSPHGGWIAYFEQPPGAAEPEINVVPWPELTRTRIPVGPGQQPVFSRDGSELFFFNDSAIQAADVTYEPSLKIGTPHRLFPTAGYMPAALGRAWDPDPSGKRFLMIRDPASTASNASGNASPQLKIDVVLNWFEELKRRVPTQ